MTDNQQAVYKFIIDYKRQNDGVSPSLNEISGACGVKSKSHVGEILRQLRDYDLIRFKPGVSRSIQVIGGQWKYEGIG